MFYGEQGFGIELLRGERPTSMMEAQSVVGQSFYIGGPAGALGSVKAAGIDVAGACNNIDYAIVLEASAPKDPFIASKKPLSFVPIVPWPTVREALVPQIETLLWAQGLTNGVVADEVWRFTRPDTGRHYFIAVAYSPRDPVEGAIGVPGDFDALVLFAEDNNALSVLDQQIARVGERGAMRAYPFPLAVAIDAIEQRIELFVHWIFYEGDEVTGYDLSHDRLQQSVVGGCYY